MHILVRVEIEGEPNPLKQKAVTRIAFRGIFSVKLLIKVVLVFPPVSYISVNPEQVIRNSRRRDKGKQS
jgi:hypothetical protein